MTVTRTLSGNQVVHVEEQLLLHLLHYSFAPASRRIHRKSSSEVQVIALYLLTLSIESLLIEAVLLDRA